MPHQTRTKSSDATSCWIAWHGRNPKCFFCSESKGAARIILPAQVRLRSGPSGFVLGPISVLDSLRISNFRGAAAAGHQQPGLSTRARDLLSATDCQCLAPRHGPTRSPWLAPLPLPARGSEIAPCPEIYSSKHSDLVSRRDGRIIREEPTQKSPRLSIIKQI